MKHLLAIDLSNLCYIGAASLSTQKEASIEKYYEAALKYLRNQYRYFKPNQVVFACDHEETYWRSKLYPEYKAHRVDNEFKQKIRTVIKRFKTENAHLCIEHAHCEADDIIYALCSYTKHLVTIVSSDGDFEQLITERVRIFNPTQFSFRPRPRDVAFNLFIKCIRGDRGDNIPSILPMITLKRLQQAYQHSNPVEFLQQHYRFSPDLQKDYERNRMLIDLKYLPNEFKTALKQKIDNFFALKSE